MKNLVFLTFILIPALAFAQKLNQKTTDPKKGNEMLVGYCNRDGFATVNSNFDSAYKAEYPLDKAEAESIKQPLAKLKGVKVTNAQSTWCGAR